jgi:hypothetical protein
MDIERALGQKEGKETTVARMQAINKILQVCVSA